MTIRYPEVRRRVDSDPSDPLLDSTDLDVVDSSRDHGGVDSGCTGYTVPDTESEREIDRGGSTSDSFHSPGHRTGWTKSL